MFLCHQADVVQVRGHPAVVEAAVAADLLLAAHQVIHIAVAAAEVLHIATPVIPRVVHIEAVRAVIAQVHIVRLRIVPARIQEYQLAVSRSGDVPDSREDMIAICQVIKRQLHIIAEIMIMCTMHWDGEMHIQVRRINQDIMMRMAGTMMKLPLKISLPVFLR